jgi:hypothetical protein
MKIKFVFAAYQEADSMPVYVQGWTVKQSWNCNINLQMWNDVGVQSPTEINDVTGPILNIIPGSSTNRLKLCTHNFGYSYMI